ncbi:MAG: glycosyltransferase family 4 protein [Fusobacterium sp.]|uniref:glycosyltransferase family 4 protein n=1 Tax=Fusobacterium sp. TaxID=68766 RepID=UPI002A75EC00|nr:glycosyltransferase family 4 protein [Fusobacterium sp.]MDY2980858.1 glycosyltransferase family 4 protein [Fusobacterium sp.]
MKRIILLRSNPVNPDPPVEKVALTLMKNGYDVIIIGWDRDGDYEIKRESLEKYDHIEIIRFGIKGQFSGGFRKNFFPLIRFQKRILKWLIKNNDKYDVIHAFDFDTGFIANLCAKKYKKSLVYHILDYYVDSHGLRGKFLGNLIEKMERYVINLSDTTIICTEKRKVQIKNTNPKRLIIIHNTPLKAENINLKKSENNKIKIVYVGILPENGRMIKELVEIVEENETLYELHIAGFGPLENYLKEKSKVNENIKFYGKIPYMKTLELENSCDIMTAIYDPSIPNHFYAAPNKFYESLMLGKPLIMIKNTGMSEIVSQYKIGEVIDYNKLSLEKGLKNLANRKNEWQEIKKIGNELYDKKYSWEIMSKRIEDLYSEL